MRYFLGIDPGFKSGAICIVSEDFSEVSFIDINDNLIEIVEKAKKLPPITFGVIERVHSSPRQGVSSAFNFGKGYGWLQALLTFLRIPHEAVDPERWMSVIATKATKLSLTDDIEGKDRERIRNKNKASIKKNTFNFCKELFPAAELTSFTRETNRADALGIAYYCWQNYREI